jgi:hypothetical protein
LEEVITTNVELEEKKNSHTMINNAIVWTLPPSYILHNVYNLEQVANKLNIAKHMLYVSPTMILAFNIPVEYNFLNPLFIIFVNFLKLKKL